MYKQLIIVRNDMNHSPAEFGKLIHKASMEFFLKIISEHASQRCHNRFFVYRGDDDTRVVNYMRQDLWDLANEMAEQGKTEFYASPDLDGVYHLCEPHRYYRIECDIDKGLFDEWYMAGAELELLSTDSQGIEFAAVTAKGLGAKEDENYFLEKLNNEYIVFVPMSTESVVYKKLTEFYSEYGDETI